MGNSHASHAARSARIAEQLGMSHGAAANRLRKMILFRQLQKYGDSVCVKCGKMIESVDDLSIEHIRPWENRSPELFWDLDNVTFSHTRCNTPHIQGSLGKPSCNRITPPEGKAWCRTHKQFFSVDRFAKNRTNWNGLRRDCIECEKNYKDRIRRKVLEDGEQGAQLVSNTRPTLAG
jgi:hypothetical protein